MCTWYNIHDIVSNLRILQVLNIMIEHIPPIFLTNIGLRTQAKDFRRGWANTSGYNKRIDTWQTWRFKLSNRDGRLFPNAMHIKHVTWQPRWTLSMKSVKRSIEIHQNATKQRARFLPMSTLNWQEQFQHMRSQQCSRLQVKAHRKKCLRCPLKTVPTTHNRIISIISHSLMTLGEFIQSK